jgi:zinc transport system substrate-binding protein
MDDVNLLKIFSVLLIFMAFLTSLTMASLSVVVTIPPLGYAMEEIGGSAVRVNVLERAGDNPHNFNLTPQQAVIISKASMLVDLGLEEDAWIAEKMKSINPSIDIVDATQGLSQFLIGDPGAYNPHVWLDVKLYEMMAINLYGSLVKVDPKDQTIFSLNLATFMISLNELDEEVRIIMMKIKGKSFVAQHPAWDYFARAYGLGFEYSLENDSGQTIGPKDYKRITEAMKKYGIRSIIGDPVTSSKLANQLSSETGATIIDINPIFTFNYFDLMRSVTNGFLEALK